MTPPEIRELFDRVHRGELRPAEAETLLADRLRVSRSPVNNALALLHRKGLLSRERNRGYFVAKPVDLELLVETIAHVAGVRGPGVAGDAAAGGGADAPRTSEPDS